MEGERDDIDPSLRVRERVLRMARVAILWASTPVLVGIQAYEATRGRYDLALGLQAVAHVGTVALLLSKAHAPLRAAVVSAYLFLTWCTILWHYGPIATVGGLVLGSAFLAHLYLGRKGALIAVSSGLASMLAIGAVQSVLRSARIPQPLSDFGSFANWGRIAMSTAVISFAMVFLVSYVIDGLQLSVRSLQAALMREREERREKEAAEAARLQAERAMAKAQKDELVARLSSGVAHDLNNVLGAILVGIDLSESVVDQPQRVSLELKRMRAATERAATLSRQLLNVGRRQVAQPRDLDITGVLKGVVPMIRWLLPETVAWQEELPDEPLRALVDPAQLEQVVLNLCLNARDACGPAGRVSLHARRHCAADGREGVLIEVRDNGVGIPESLRGRIFEPFFTTKPEGRGSGLGLATVATIVRDSGGEIDFDSRLGEGTSFRTWWPSALSDSQVVAGRHLTERPAQKGRVLVVDDDTLLRDSVARLLSTSGYEVRSAGSLSQALEVADGHSFEAVVLDATLPDGSGAAVHRELRERGASSAFVLTTGFDLQAFGKELLSTPGHVLLHKPFDREELLSALKRAVRGAQEQLPPSSRWL